MSLIGAILYVLVRFYTLLLIARLVIEMIAAYSQQFRPARWFAVISEPIFQVTDPPVKAVRRIIPPLRAGGVAIDISVLVIFFVLSLALAVIRATML